MAAVYKSKTTGEMGIYDEAGRFAWVSREEAKECLLAGTWYCEDGEPIEDNDPLWDSLLHITNLEG